MGIAYEPNVGGVVGFKVMLVRRALVQIINATFSRNKEDETLRFLIYVREDCKKMWIF